MSGTTSKPTKADVLAFLRTLVAGLQKHFPTGNFTIGTVTFTTATLVQLLTELITAITASNEAQAHAKDAVAGLRATRAKVGPVLTGLRRILVAMFTGDTQTLADLGLQPPKARKPLTAEQAAAKAAKATATRAKRGTKGPKKRLLVKGDVIGVTVTPVTAPQAIAPAPAAQTVSNASNAPNGASK